jgi:RecA/RadA recombinase
MAKKVEAPVKKTNSLANRLKKASGSEYASVLSDNEYPIKGYISLGNYMLNALVSADPFKGLPRGRSIELAGQKGVGKTYIGIEACRNAQAQNFTAAIFDSEFANNDNQQMKDRGLDTDNVIWSGVETCEDLKTQALKMLEEIDGNKDDVIFLVDSIGNLSTNKEMADSLAGEDKRDMTRAQLLKALFRTVTMRLGYKNVPMIAINHVYASTGSFIPQDVVAGGGGPAYGCSIIVIFSKAMLRDKDKNVTGALITAKTDKNRFAKEKMSVKFVIDFDGGLNLYSGLLEFCVDEGLLVPTTKLPKNGDVSGVKTFAFRGEEISRKKLTPDFWEAYLREELGDVLRKKFKYQSSADGVIDMDEEGEESEAELLQE